MTSKSVSPAKCSSSGKPVLILVAAGSSSRMGGVKKEYLPMKGGTVLSSAARVFLETLPFSLCIVTYPATKTEDERKEAEKKCRDALFADPFVKDSADIFSSQQNNETLFLFVPGGKSRQESVLHALEAAAEKLSAEGNGANPLVFIHDGARPFVSPDIIIRSSEAAEKYGASVPALQPVDTQKALDENGFITRHLVRANLAAVQTPQVFRFRPLLSAHRAAAKDQREYTDDTEIWDTYAADGKKLMTTKIVAGSSENKKITYPSDLPQIEAKEQKMKIRTGLGYDKHVLTEGRRLMLGGIEIPFEKGEAGHSDGDVLLHAITDALLGAAAMGDIGSYFPPEEAKWKDADSKMLLQTVWKDITNKGWSLGNMDCVLELEKPKFLPHRDAVRHSIAQVLGVDDEQIFVKAKTGEKTGDVGSGKVVEAFVTCLLTRN